VLLLLRSCGSLALCCSVPCSLVLVKLGLQESYDEILHLWNGV